MPVNATTERNPHRWQRAMDVARAQMLATGWIERSGKFNEVRHRKAVKLYPKIH